MVFINFTVYSVRLNRKLGFGEDTHPHNGWSYLTSQSIASGSANSSISDLTVGNTSDTSGKSVIGSLMLNIDKGDNANNKMMINSDLVIP